MKGVCQRQAEDEQQILEHLSAAILSPSGLVGSKKKFLFWMEPAESVAARLNGERGKNHPTDSQVLMAYAAIVEWPEQNRPNVAPASSPFVNGVVLGLTPNRMGSCSISQMTLQCPELTKLTVDWIAHSLPAFRFGSIQVNYNYAARKHIDSNNLGPSYIKAIGDFEGGELWTSDRGVLDCREWRLFDGNTSHATNPFRGQRVSFIAFTPDAYNRLSKGVCDSARRLGFTAASSDGADDEYFSNFRDIGVVDENDFDNFTQNHHMRNPPLKQRCSLTVETNGYAAGRGWGYVAWRGVSEDDRLEDVERVGKLARFKKNQTGIHVVELDLCGGDEESSFEFVEIHRFGLYQYTESESERFLEWVQALPRNRVVACVITDTAMAKTRPLPACVYTAFGLLGAADDLCLIGYREPFTFVGYKGARRGQAAYMLDAKKKSKTLLRMDCTFARNEDDDAVIEINAAKTSFKVLDEIGKNVKEKKQQRKISSDRPLNMTKKKRVM